MIVQCILLLVVSAGQHYCEDGSTEVQTEVGVLNEGGSVQDTAKDTLSEPLEVPAESAVTNVSNAASNTQPKRTPRVPRRRGRRLRGFYNSDRFRNNAYNPYNPNSPFSFRGRPPQSPYAQGYYRTGYENQYYDPYKQGYYNYPGYPQTGYYGYPYQPQPVAPQPGQAYYPPTPPPTEAIPDLYYVRDSPDGYQYQKVSVAPDVGRAQPMGHQQPQPQPQPQPHPGYGQAPQGYYGYQYDPYRRLPPQAHPPQPYYQQPQYGYPQGQQSSVYQQQMQWAQRYTYSRGRRSRFMRTGRPTLRTLAPSHSWKLTIAPEPQFGQHPESPALAVPGETAPGAQVD